MEFSHQTRGTIAQVLAASSDDGVRTFIYKHLGVIESKLPPPRALLKEADADAIRAMVVELLAVNKVLRATAPVKYVFEQAVGELQRWVLHDG